MSNYKLTLLEQETIIRFNREEKTAGIFTHDPSLKRKLEQLANEHACVQLERSEDSWGAVEYTIPKKLITIRKPVKTKPLTADEKKKLADRLRESRGKQE